MPPRKMMFAGTFPAFDDAAPGRPEQLKLNLECDLTDHPKFISKHDHEIPFLDISIRWSTKEGLVHGCHTGVSFRSMTHSPCASSQTEDQWCQRHKKAEHSAQRS